MPTVVENIRKEKNANLCYVEDAILGNRPFEIASGFKHFKVDEHSWTYDWSEEKRQKHLREFHEALQSQPRRQEEAFTASKMSWDWKKVGKDINKTLKVGKVPLRKRGKCVR